jgi:hypothetical protein
MKTRRSQRGLNVIGLVVAAAAVVVIGTMVATSSVPLPGRRPAAVTAPVPSPSDKGVLEFELRWGNWKLPPSALQVSYVVNNMPHGPFLVTEQGHLLRQRWYLVVPDDGRSPVTFGFTDTRPEARSVLTCFIFDLRRGVEPVDRKTFTRQGACTYRLS